jgi:2-phospho-L-lactate/phosphoenolpyruvate guanylyltransferase
MWVVIPVKPFIYAKQRLAHLLQETERAALARVMLEDLLGTLSSCARVTGVLLVGQPAALGEIAQRHGCEVLAEQERGLSRAVTQAAVSLAARGMPSMLMLPGDVPLAGVHEIDILIAGHEQSGGVTLVSDREGFGTNALAVDLPARVPFLFGRESFAAHCAAAREAGLTVQVLDLPGISFDIDLPEDLRDLMNYDSEAQTLAYLAACGLISRPQAQSAW